MNFKRYNSKDKQGMFSFLFYCMHFFQESRQFLCPTDNLDDEHTTPWTSSIVVVVSMCFWQKSCKQEISHGKLSNSCT
jgi:hypothetical protein